MSLFEDSLIIKFLNNRPSLRQFIKFSLVGGFNTIVDLVAYIFFTRVIPWHYLVAGTLAFLIAATNVSISSVVL